MSKLQNLKLDLSIEMDKVKMLEQEIVDLETLEIRQLLARKIPNSGFGNFFREIIFSGKHNFDWENIEELMRFHFLDLIPELSELCEKKEEK